MTNAQPARMLDAALDRLAAGPADRLTAALDLPETRGQVSAVLATYNRCPFAPAAGRLRDNPLSWALDTLLGQAGHALAEIVLVDDASTDHTPAVLARYTGADTPVPVRTIRRRIHGGACAARNDAIDAASGRWLLFGDDDCVFRPHYAAGAAYTLARLTEADPAACGVTLPFYYRALRPRDVVPTAQIGRLNPTTAWFSTRFHAFPAEYLPDPPRLDERTGVLAPLPVDLVNGTCLLDAAAVRTVGGFADLSAWRTAYSDHLTLAADLTAAGGHLYHCPDPRLSAPHLKFGARGRFPLAPVDLSAVVEGLGRRFADLVALSQDPRTDTGCRTTPGELLTEMIGSLFAFFTARSTTGGRAWGVRMHQDFVVAGNVHSLSLDTSPPAGERRQLWRDGLARGARVAADHPPRRRPGTDLQAVLNAVTEQVGEPRIIAC